MYQEHLYDAGGSAAGSAHIVRGSKTFPEFVLRDVEVAAVDLVFARAFIGQLAIRARGNMSPCRGRPRNRGIGL
jgi:hypothetical protein